MLGASMSGSACHIKQACKEINSCPGKGCQGDLEREAAGHALLGLECVLKSRQAARATDLQLCMKALLGS